MITAELLQAALSDNNLISQQRVSDYFCSLPLEQEFFADEWTWVLTQQKLQLLAKLFLSGDEAGMPLKSELVSVLDVVNQKGLILFEDGKKIKRLYNSKCPNAELAVIALIMVKSSLVDDLDRITNSLSDDAKFNSSKATSIVAYYTHHLMIDIIQSLRDGNFNLNFIRGFLPHSLLGKTMVDIENKWLKASLAQAKLIFARELAAISNDSSQAQQILVYFFKLFWRASEQSSVYSESNIERLKQFITTLADYWLEQVDNQAEIYDLLLSYEESRQQQLQQQNHELVLRYKILSRQLNEEKQAKANFFSWRK